MKPKRFLFQRLVSEGMIQDFNPGDTQKAKKWYRTQVGKIKDISSTKLLRSPEVKANEQRRIMQPGDLFMFEYDPKLKHALPYYDRFPVVLIIDKAPGGFLGLNFHYLPPMLRSALLDQLYEHTNNEKFDHTTRIEVSYRELKGISTTPYYKPCMKRYLNNHVTSRYIKIHPAEWDFIVLLPLERIEKKSKRSVWTESRKQLKR